MLTRLLSGANWRASFWLDRGPSHPARPSMGTPNEHADGADGHPVPAAPAAPQDPARGAAEWYGAEYQQPVTADRAGERTTRNRTLPKGRREHVGHAEAEAGSAARSHPPRSPARHPSSAAAPTPAECR